MPTLTITGVYAGFISAIATGRVLIGLLLKILGARTCPIEPKNAGNKWINSFNYERFNLTK